MIDEFYCAEIGVFFLGVCFARVVMDIQLIVSESREVYYFS